MRGNDLNGESTATNFTSKEESFSHMNLATGKKMKKSISFQGIAQGGNTN